MLDCSVKINRSDDLSKRAFISIIINGKRIKEYTGSKLGLNVKPNSCKTINERDALLELLQYEFKKAIDLKEYPKKVSSLINPDYSISSLNNISLHEALTDALNIKLSSNISPLYKRNLSRVYNSFMEYIHLQKHTPLTDIKPKLVQDYLNQFISSNTYYMDKRRDLNVLFTKAFDQLGISNELFKKIERKKAKSTLHKVYEGNQAREVLDYLKVNSENLYICCLLSYGCFLRPHIEVRKLKGKHFKFDCTEIHLSGNENKSGRVRVTPIPKYVRDVIYDRVSRLASNQNLFTGTEEYFNDDYFSKLWNRVVKKMKLNGIIEDKQTIYSFRHTAAVNVYKKTKDLHILQQLLGHSDMIVTLKYLRGLGVHNTEELRNVMPEL